MRVATQGFTADWVSMDQDLIPIASVSVRASWLMGSLRNRPVQQSMDRPALREVQAAFPQGIAHPLHLQLKNGSLLSNRIHRNMQIALRYSPLVSL
jgi:hypothetical protein